MLLRLLKSEACRERLEQGLQRGLADGRLEALRSWWQTRANELTAAARVPDDVPDLLEGLDPGLTVERYVDQRVLGMHFLVRRGAEGCLVYFHPAALPPGRAMAPFVDRAALDGLELTDEALALPEGINRHIPGLCVVEVQTEDDGERVQIGSHLAARAGLAQYIPDSSQEATWRKHIPFAHTDLLIRNRASLYLPLPQGRCDDEADVQALLIVQSAIPGFLGEDAVLARESQHYEALNVPYRMDSGWFDQIERALFDTGEDRRDFDRYVAILNHVARYQGELAASERARQGRVLGHWQKGAWGFVRDSYERMVRRLETLEGDRPAPSDDGTNERRLGKILIDQLGFAVNVGLSDLGAEHLMGDGRLDQIVRLLGWGSPRIFVEWTPSFDRKSVCPPTCGRRELAVRTGLKESVLSAMLLEVLRNAWRHGGLQKTVEIWWGCWEHIGGIATDVRLLHEGRTKGSWRLEAAQPRDLIEMCAAGAFVGVLDHTDLPCDGLSSEQFPNRHGLGPLARLVGAIRGVLGSPAQVGFARIEGRRGKMAFILLPGPAATSTGDHW